MNPYRVTVIRQGESEERSADFATLKEAKTAARQEWALAATRVALWRHSAGAWWLQFEQGRMDRVNMN